MSVACNDLLRLLAIHRSVIPSGGGPTKKAPIIDWLEYQKRLPTREEVVEWHRAAPSLWGIITGEISLTIVFDADDAAAIDIFHKADLKPHVKTKRGEHYYFKWPGHLLINRVGVLPHIDLRGDGGFVNCLGTNENASYSMLIFPDQDRLYDMTQLPLVVKQALLKSPTVSNKFIQVGEKIPQGHQEKWLFYKARTYKAQGDTEEMIIEKLKIDALRCPQIPGNPFTERNFKTIAHSAFRYTNGTDGIIYEDIPESQPQTKASHDTEHSAMDKPKTKPKIIIRGGVKL
jgi:putative DNA primase/helicase